MPVFGWYQGLDDDDEVIPYPPTHDLTPAGWRQHWLVDPSPEINPGLRYDSTPLTIRHGPSRT